MARVDSISASRICFWSFFFSYLSKYFFYVAEATNVCNSANYGTFYQRDRDFNSFMNWLEHDCYLEIEWFQNSLLKLNQNKCHLIV